MEDILFNLEKHVLNAGVWGPIIYIGIIIIAIIISPVPSSPLIIFAGTIFGMMWGILWTMIGATLGAIIAFYIARIFGRPFVIRLVPEKKLSAIEERFPEHHIAWGIFLSRLLPLPFFDAVSYVAGLTTISIKSFIIATVFGLMPLVFIFTYFGDIFSDNFIGVSILIIIVIIIFFVFTKTFYNYNKKQ